MSVGQAVRLAHLASLHTAIGTMLDCILAAASVSGPAERHSVEHWERIDWDVRQSVRHAVWAARNVMDDDSEAYQKRFGETVKAHQR